MTSCNPIPSGRRRLFWSTQSNACDRLYLCGEECAQPGLVVEDDGTISTDNWITGLIMNMLMTDGRQPDKPCGYSPNAHGGHWSESYIASGPATVGTLARTIPPVGRIQEAQSLVAAYVQETLSRLVDRGVAQSVEVTVEYAGSNKFNIEILVFGILNELAKVGLTGERLPNGWVWSN